jgi:hypothetical protein
MRSALLTLALCACMLTSLSAQTGVPTAWVLRVYAAGAATALSSITVATSQVACNAPVPPTGSTVNPTTWIWDDVVNVGMTCSYVDTRLPGLPDGSFEGTAQALNADGSSAETARVPFSRRRANPPAVPGTLRIIRPAP